MRRKPKRPLTWFKQQQQNISKAKLPSLKINLGPTMGTTALVSRQYEPSGEILGFLGGLPSPSLPAVQSFQILFPYLKLLSIHLFKKILQMLDGTWRVQGGGKAALCYPHTRPGVAQMPQFSPCLHICVEIMQMPTSHAFHQTFLPPVFPSYVSGEITWKVDTNEKAILR